MDFKLNQCLLVALVIILAVGCASKSQQLRSASFNGNTDKVQALLEQGADVNAKYTDGFTALMAAKVSGDKEIVHILK